MNHKTEDSIAMAICLAGIVLPISFIAAWMTHIIVCIQTHEWLLLIAGAIMFPVAIVHGFGTWFGVWQ